MGALVATPGHTHQATLTCAARPSITNMLRGQLGSIADVLPAPALPEAMLKGLLSFMTEHANGRLNEACDVKSLLQANAPTEDAAQSANIFLISLPGLQERLVLRPRW